MMKKISVLGILTVLFCVSMAFAATYNVNDCNDLQNIGTSLGTCSDNFVLTTSFACSGSFTPLCSGGYSGTFDGNNNTITGLTINLPSTSFVGLFSKVISGRIKNVRIVNANVKGAGEVGVITGYASSAIIDNSYVSGTVSGTDTVVGGMVGRLYYPSSVLNSKSSCDVSGTEYIGGLTGIIQDFCLVNNSYSTGKVTGTGYRIGGLSGTLGGSIIDNSYATGAVIGGYYVGGLVGDETYYSKIINSYSTGTTSGNQFIGGLVGHLSQSYVINSYSTGNNLSGANTGGLVGFAEGSEAVISNSYWDICRTSQPNCCGYGTAGSTCTNNCTGKNSLSNKNTAYFYDIDNAPMNVWNFISVWNNSYNGTAYPILLNPAGPKKTNPDPCKSDTIPELKDNKNNNLVSIALVVIIALVIGVVLFKKK